MKQILLIMIGLSISLLADFSRNNDTQIVTDNETGLQWQDNESVNKTWQGAIDYCENLTLGSYEDWRLPNINELTSLVDDSKSKPSIDTVVIHTGSKGYYWSSTTRADYSGIAWSVNFGYGFRASKYKDANLYVRCVRTGQ